MSEHWHLRNPSQGSGLLSSPVQAEGCGWHGRAVVHFHWCHLGWDYFNKRISYTVFLVVVFL